MWKKIEDGYGYESSIQTIALVPGAQFPFLSIFFDRRLFQTRTEESLEIRRFPPRFVLFVDGLLIFEEDLISAKYDEINALSIA